MRGGVDGHTVVAGRASWLADQWSQPLGDQLATALAAAESAGRTAIAVGRDGAARASVELVSGRGG